MLNTFVSLVFLCAVTLTAIAQTGTPAPLPDPCEKACSASPGLCHLQRARYLLHGFDDPVADCVRADLPRLSLLDPIARISLGIRELDAAMADPRGIAAPPSELRFETSAARIDLARLDLVSRDVDGADREFQEAAAIYLSLFRDERALPMFIDVGPRIAAGLLRCGRPVEALRVLNELPNASSSRAYLSAEAWFSLGERQAAAQQYERWIESGCQFKMAMLLDDEYGRSWTLLMDSKPTNQSRCEQIPTELRSRLETLKEQFGHPANLPLHSYPGILFEDRTDF